VNNIVANVAQNLKVLRAQRGLTLVSLAERSRVAKATLSNLESGRGNPTVETLYALADTLDVPFSDLISDPNEPVAEIVRASEGLQVRGAIDARVLDRMYGFGMAEILEIVCPAGGRREAAPHARGVIEHIFVAEGRLRAGPAHEPALLETGDFVRFPGDCPHVYESIGGEARALAIMTYPAPLSTG
jgi:transcriptional regulator with XRE-family HTH domain